MLKIERFQKVSFFSRFKIEVWEYKTFNLHRAIFHVYGSGEEFTSNDLQDLRSEIRKNLSLSWFGNFAFGLVLYDFVLNEDFHYKMVDAWCVPGGCCVWAIVVDTKFDQAYGIRCYSEGYIKSIFENILQRYPQYDGSILNKCKPEPNCYRWDRVLHFPWLLLNPKNRPWIPAPKFRPPFDQEKHYDGVDFGQNMAWFALRCENPLEAASALQIRIAKKVDWETGVEAAYQGNVFLTPAVDGWVLVAGKEWLNDFPQSDSAKTLDSLSRKFGEAQFFATHRAFQSHTWSKAVDGRIIRAFSCTGDAGFNETLWNEGEPTEIENRADFDATNVLKIAADWSVDPSELEIRPGIPSCGFVGQIEGKALFPATTAKHKFSPRAEKYLEKATRDPEFVCTRSELRRFLNQTDCCLSEYLQHAQLEYAGLILPAEDAGHEFWLELFSRDEICGPPEENYEYYDNTEDRFLDMTWFAFGIIAAAPYYYFINQNGEIANLCSEPPYMMCSSIEKWIERYALEQELERFVDGWHIFAGKSDDAILAALHKRNFEPIEECTDQYRRFFTNGKFTVIMEPPAMYPKGTAFRFYSPTTPISIKTLICDLEDDT